MENYSLEFSDRFKKQFRKLDRYTQKFIRSWIDKNITDTTNPRLHGKALAGELRDYWRYRIGDYRLICEIKDKELIILALEIGHRRDIYKH